MIVFVFADKPSLTQPFLPHTDVQQDYIDAKVAAVLCTGGPCKYKLREGSGVTDEWLLKHVAKNIHQRYGEGNPVAKVLALPLLWACFEGKDERQQTGGPNHVPYYIMDEVMKEYGVIRQLGEEVNPVRKASTCVFLCLSIQLCSV